MKIWARGGKRASFFFFLFCLGKKVREHYDNGRLALFVLKGGLVMSPGLSDTCIPRKLSAFTSLTTTELYDSAMLLEDKTPIYLLE